MMFLVLYFFPVFRRCNYFRLRNGFLITLLLSVIVLFSIIALIFNIVAVLNIGESLAVLLICHPRASQISALDE
jgi:hypothetical protein